MAKPIKTLELHYQMIQFLIILYIFNYETNNKTILFSSSTYPVHKNLAALDLV